MNLFFDIPQDILEKILPANKAWCVCLNWVCYAIVWCIYSVDRSLKEGLSLLGTLLTFLINSDKEDHNNLNIILQVSKFTCV